MKRGIVLLLLLFTLPISGWATGIALSQVTIDWTGFTYTTTGLSIIRIAPLSGFTVARAGTSSVPTVLDPRSGSLPPNSGVNVSFADSTGIESAQASLINGLIQLAAQASTLGSGSAFHSATARTNVGNTLELSASGIG